MHAYPQISGSDIIVLDEDIEMVPVSAYSGNTQTFNPYGAYGFAPPPPRESTLVRNRHESSYSGDPTLTRHPYSSYGDYHEKATR